MHALLAPLRPSRGLQIAQIVQLVPTIGGTEEAPTVLSVLWGRCPPQRDKSRALHALVALWLALVGFLHASNVLLGLMIPLVAEAPPARIVLEATTVMLQIKHLVPRVPLAKLLVLRGPRIAHYAKQAMLISQVVRRGARLAPYARRENMQLRQEQVIVQSATQDLSRPLRGSLHVRYVPLANMNPVVLLAHSVLLDQSLEIAA